MQRCLTSPEAQIVETLEVIEFLGIYGAGGCGRGVMPIARELPSPEYDRKLMFIDDRLAGQRINGHDVISFADLCRIEPSRSAVAVAIADPQVRRAVVEQCAKANLRFVTVQANQSVVMDDVTIGEGALISPYVTITSNVVIGTHFHANLYSYVEHDCRIGDYVTFAPRASCNGNVVIEDDAYIGAGAVIRQGTQRDPLIIGRGAVIGMGAVVTKNVPAGCTVVGNPARPIDQPS